ncbi:MAG: hypothetical protein PHO00_08530 [bacterium]|nr:hypothetical protein [bacterium]
MKSDAKGKKFVIGVGIITVSYFLGVPVLVAGIAFISARKYFAGLVCLVIYGISWLLLLAGIFMSGKEGYCFVKEKIRIFRSGKKKVEPDDKNV